MNEKSKGGRPKDSKSANPHGLIGFTVGDQSGGVSRSGTMYGVREFINMSPDEIAEIKARREAVRIQAEKDDRTDRFAKALAAVASGELNINQASLQYDVRRATLTAHAAAAKTARQRPRLIALL
jgi:hypothetical protein